MKTVEVEFPMPEVKQYTLNPKDSALIIIDMENDFIRKEGGGYLGERVEHIVPNLTHLIGKFRAAGSKIIYIQSVRKPDALEFTVFKHKPILLENTWGSEIIEELAPISGEPIVQKWNHDSWHNTNMEGLLESLGLVPARSQILVTGVATQVCVECALTGFRERDYLVYLPIDSAATKSYDAEVAAYWRFSAARSPNLFFTRSDLVDFV